MSERTGNLALTSARALPPTPFETWNWEYCCGESMARLAGFVAAVVVGRANAEVRREKRRVAWRCILVVGFMAIIVEVRF